MRTIENSGVSHIDQDCSLCLTQLTLPGSLKFLGSGFFPHTTVASRSRSLAFWGLRVTLECKESAPRVASVQLATLQSERSALSSYEATPFQPPPGGRIFEKHLHNIRSAHTSHNYTEVRWCCGPVAVPPWACGRPVTALQSQRQPSES